MGGSRSRGSGRREHWSALIAQWRDSGKTQVGFCTDRGVSIHSFRWWKFQLRATRMRPRRREKPARSRRGSTTLVPVEVIGGPHRGSEPIEILLLRGRAIRLHGDFDPAVLRKALGVLESLEC